MRGITYPAFAVCLCTSTGSCPVGMADSGTFYGSRWFQPYPCAEHATTLEGSIR